MQSLDANQFLHNSAIPHRSVLITSSVSNFWAAHVYVRKRTPTLIAKNSQQSNTWRWSNGKHEQTKPLRGFGSVWSASTYRAAYTVRFEGMVFVLHVFQRKVTAYYRPRRRVRGRLRRLWPGILRRGRIDYVIPSTLAAAPLRIWAAPDRIHLAEPRTCHSHQATNSDPMKSLRHSARAGWARCTAPATAS
jgi:phage-related protein